MKKVIFFVIFIIFPFRFCIGQADTTTLFQKGTLNQNEEHFSYFTFDRLEWDSVEYLFSESPLNIFGDLEELYPYKFNILPNYMAPPYISLPKYIICYLLKDNILYIKDIFFTRIEWWNEEVLKKNTIYQQRFKTMEDLTGQKMNKDSLIKVNWLNGYIDIKRDEVPEGLSNLEYYDYGEFYRLHFTQGKLDSVKLIKPTRESKYYPVIK